MIAERRICRWIKACGHDTELLQARVQCQGNESTTVMEDECRKLRALLDGTKKTNCDGKGGGIP
jgi:hypothetical protein